ncbi:hypothetical protein T265_07862 [Opisthorchis viverrini]|uniref:Uncharacterized protein n=1 Tax=Opisthorchis viverrini TaxID=6198 RepID=A0A075AAA0_OPIVI|nr:hypothetical protein T265_07862 [Opisthorchis viverrini]KER24499.1 hypothetical protein T265_07862 [Opisthorchis viverrini]
MDGAHTNTPWCNATGCPSLQRVPDCHTRFSPLAHATRFAESTSHLHPLDLTFLEEMMALISMPFIKRDLFALRECRTTVVDVNIPPDGRQMLVWNERRQK